MNARIAFAGVAAAALMISGAVAAQASSRPHSAAAANGVAALRQATDRFHNLQHAENAGYGFFTDAKGIACIAMPGMGGMGVHFVDSALVADPAEHSRRPEALVYRIDRNGRLVLAAVEYVVIAAAWNATHPMPPRLFGHAFGLTAAGNRYGLPAYYSLHAWVWYHNPAGTFAPFNPRVRC